MDTNLEMACTLRARLRGLLGRRVFDGVLLLVPCRDVHTFGMRAPLDIAFVAADGKVVETHRAVGPRRRLRNRAAIATLERFASDAAWFAVGDPAIVLPVQDGSPSMTEAATPGSGTE